jgi:putative flavoprotein involved in K+ transport
MTPRHHDVVVIGGGQAGLAIGHHLAAQDRDFVILDGAAEPAAAWQARWDSLRLFTSARYSALPGRPFPGDPGHHPSRDEVVEYLIAYAHDLPVELDSRVSRVAAIDGGYRVELEDRAYEAEQVVVATGPFQTPRIPALARDLDASVRSLHSSEYRRPAQIPPGRVLVVGGGNTGFQIAEELAGTHGVHLAIGSRQTPMPQRILGRDTFRVLDSIGAMTKTADTFVGRRMKAHDTLVGSSPRRARRQGVRLRPRATAAQAACVAFEDGSEISVDAVIWATGFGTDHGWIEADIFDRDGRVVQQRGVTPAPGLFVLGLPWMHTRGSALLGWVGDDAAYLARQIGARSARERPVGLLDGSRDVNPRARVELAEHVADVRLDGLRAEEQLARDLAVGPAVDDQPSDLELARGERRDAGLVEVSRPRPAMDPLP